MYMSGVFPHSRCLGSHKTAQSIVFLCLLAPIIFAILTLELSPAAAGGGGVCTLKSLGTFGNTVVDVVGNAAASATSQVEYNCRSSIKFNSIQFCTYIQAADGNQANSQVGSTFYQARDANAHLAWQMRLQNGGDMPVGKYGSTRSTVGWTHYTNWSPSNQSTIASQQLTLTYLDRHQQDRVKAGVYSNAYQLVTQYKFNAGTPASSCSSGIADPDGTIFSNFMTTANVTKNCQLENFQDIDFGNQNGLEFTSRGAGQFRAYGNVGIRCTYQTPYKISINSGNNPENGVARLKSDNNFLPYKLLQAGCKAAWDDKNVLSGNGNIVNIVDNHQVCAEIITPLAIAPAPGIYIDTVIVTATF